MGFVATLALIQIAGQLGCPSVWVIIMSFVAFFESLLKLGMWQQKEDHR